MTTKARALRNGATPAERRLWQRLRRDALGVRFRRQMVIGQRHIVDFYAPEIRLAIEVDGSQHVDQVAEDRRRTLWLNAQGIHVLRFSNTDVLHRTDDVTRAIHDAVIARLALPSPGGRGVGGEGRNMNEPQRN